MLASGWLVEDSVKKFARMVCASQILIDVICEGSAVGVQESIYRWIGLDCSESEACR